MPPIASTSKLHSCDSALPRSPSASAEQSRDGASSSSTGMPTMHMDSQGNSSDEDELDEEQPFASPRAPSGKTNKATASSRSLKQRASTSASTQSPMEDYDLAAGNTDPNTPNTTTTSTTGSNGGNTNNNNQLSKEELALADRRRRNRETQRAIRKKKANRLQEAELKATSFEAELEHFKLLNRDLENELLVLKRELENWRSGRIQANPSLLLQPSSSSSSSTQLLGSNTTLKRGRMNIKEEEDHYRSTPHPEELAYSRASSSSHYHSYQAPSEERQIKRRQSTDISRQHPTSRHYITASPMDAPSNIRSNRIGSPSSMHSAALGSIHRQSPSVLQPVPTVPYGRVTPIMEYAASQRAGNRNPDQPSALDTNSNEEGSYAGSDPSPSSAGTVVPSYTSAFNVVTGEVLASSAAASSLISEAVQAVRAQNGVHATSSTIPTTLATAAVVGDVIPNDNIPRSHSILSTTTSSISDRPFSSFDDYNDFWNSNSQSDSLTSASMSSYKSGIVPPHNHYSSSPHIAAGVTGSVAGYSNGNLSSTGADGMILSMSRSSLCASPLSIAEEKDESILQSLNGPPVSAEEDMGSDARSMQQSQHPSLQQQNTQNKPILPSLSSTLKGDHYGNNGLRSPDRTNSLPLPAPNMTTSPQASYLPSFRPAYPHTQAHHAHLHHHHHYAPAQRLPSHNQQRTSPESHHPTTLPPISSVLHSRQANSTDLLPPPSVNKKNSITTRNGRGKSTSFPILDTTSFDHHPGSLEPHNRSFNWPSALPNNTTTSTSNASASVMFGDAPRISPLPRRASTRAPMSSTRDEDASVAAEHSHHLQQDHHSHESAKIGIETIASPSAYDEDNSAIIEDDADAEKMESVIDSGNTTMGNSRKPQRRKSTYEDFVELFGNQGTA